MSYSTFYVVRVDGSLKWLCEQRNGWLWSPQIWTFLFDKYVPKKHEYDSWMGDGGRKLWGLQNDERLRREERLALLATFDMVWIPREIHREVVMASLGLGATLPVFELDDAMRSGEFIGWCGHGTSVSEDQWLYYADGDTDHSEQLVRNVLTGPALKKQMPWRIDTHEQLKEARR